MKVDRDDPFEGKRGVGPPDPINERVVMFQGAAALSLDAKGRLAVPARHRDVLAVACEGRLVITAHPHRCLLVYPQPAWEPIKAKVLAAPSFNDKSASIKRLLVGYADSQDMDGQGRVLISPALRRFGELDKQVWLVGQGSHFELWSDARWLAEQEKMFALDGSDLPADLETLSL